MCGEATYLPTIAGGDPCVMPSRSGEMPENLEKNRRLCEVARKIIMEAELERVCRRLNCEDQADTPRNPGGKDVDRPIAPSQFSGRPDNPNMSNLPGRDTLGGTPSPEVQPPPQDPAGRNLPSILPTPQPSDRNNTILPTRRG